MYEFKCCEKQEIFCSYEDSSKMKCPKCGKKMKKLISSPGYLITDTSFCMTGKVDNRFGPRPIEGRSDWNRRLEEKGYIEYTQQDMKNMS